MYIRYRNGSTWSAWKRLALAEEVGGPGVVSGSGSLDIQSNQTNLVTVNFPSTFASVPKVVVSIKGNLDPTKCNLTVNSTTTTSFIAYGFNNGPSALTVEFDWIAVGQ
jgi:hypothetical protein